MRSSWCTKLLTKKLKAAMETQIAEVIKTASTQEVVVVTERYLSESYASFLSSGSTDGQVLLSKLDDNNITPWSADSRTGSWSLGVHERGKKNYTPVCRLRSFAPCPEKVLSVPFRGNCYRNVQGSSSIECDES